MTTKLVLTKVPSIATESDLKQLFHDLPIDSIIFHHFSPLLFTHSVTLTFPSPEFLTSALSKCSSKRRGKFDLSFPNGSRFTLSSHFPEIKFRPQQDDISRSANKYSQGHFISDWQEPSPIPPSTVFLSLRYNFLSEFSFPLPSLTHLDLTGNNLTRIISLTNFPSLNTVFLSHNFLEHLPEFSPSIVTFRASYCRLVDVHPSIINASKLLIFDISFNQITKIPALPSQIRDFLADHNVIQSIEETARLKDLDEITLNDNQIETIPTCFNGRLSNNSLRLNQLKNFSVSWFSDSITTINLSQNLIESIPIEVFKMRQLTTLILFDNRISIVPPEFANSGLIVFDISENPLVEFPRIPFSLNCLKVNFCGISNFSEIIPPQNRLRSFHSIGNGMENLPILPVVEELIVAGNCIQTLPTFSVNIYTPFIFDFSCNSITNIPEISAYWQLFDITNNCVSVVPDSIFRGRSRLSLTGNPINQIFNELSETIESIEINKTDIQIHSIGDSLQELISNFTGNESNDERFLYFEFNDSVGYAEMLGFRQNMEDAMIIRQHFRENSGLYAVFDGHGGERTARSAAAAFPLLFGNKSLTSESVLEIVDEFQRILVEIGESSGSTMDLLFLEGNRALISHLGDGKVVVFDAEGKARFQTEDQNPKSRKEFERLREEKIAVKNLRTAGLIAMSRSLGDIDVPGVSHVPEFYEWQLGERDRWIVLGCDGLWDDMDFGSTGKTLLKSKSTMEAARLLRDQAFSRGSEDNISVLVIDRHI
jgi:serine/threonine protein phosphatase PrpC